MKRSSPVLMKFPVELRRRIRESSQKIGTSPQQIIQWAIGQGLRELLNTSVIEKKLISQITNGSEL